METLCERNRNEWHLRLGEGKGHERALLGRGAHWMQRTEGVETTEVQAGKGQEGVEGHARWKEIDEWKRGGK